jgi:hypothetical protein
VVARKPYDPNVSITKLECEGHVRKWIGARLRRLVKEETGIKFHDSKPLGGKGRLTQSEIDKLQNYYGLPWGGMSTIWKSGRQLCELSFFTNC